MTHASLVRVVRFHATHPYDLPDQESGRSRRLFGDADLNREVPPVHSGELQPTTEVLARWFFELLAPRIPGEAELVRVRLAESEDLAAVHQRESGVAEGMSD